MISDENKKIIDMLRGEQTPLDKNEKIEDIANELIKQKLFLYFFPSVMNDRFFFNDDFYLRKYLSMIIKKNILFDFFIDVVLFLNELKIEYVVLKGFVNELLIYDSITSRYFTDVDILVESEDFERTIEAFKNSKFKIRSISKLYDYYLHEVKIIISHKDKDYTLEIKRRHRELKYKNNRYLIKSREFLRVNDIEVPRLNTTNIFVSSCLYIYNYFERIESILYLQKIRMSYFFDLYNLLIKYSELINLEEIVNRYETTEIEKITLILKYLNEIFIDRRIYRYLSFFRKRCLNDVAIIRWNFSILERIFNEKKVKEIIRQSFENSFYVNDVTERLNTIEFDVVYQCFKSCGVCYCIKQLDNEIQFIFYCINNIKYSHYIIYLILYYKNTYSEFTEPFTAVSFRKQNDIEFVYKNKTVEKKNHKFRLEEEKNVFTDYTNSSNALSISINYRKFGIRDIPEEKIAFQIELIEIDDDCNVTIVDRNNDVFSIPSVICINKT